MGKTIVPENSQDKVLFAVMVVGIPFAVVWLGGFVVPHYHQSFDSVLLIHIATTTFIIYNIFYNILFVIRTDASGRTSQLPSVLKPGWHYCHVCQLNYPPRSYHCPICKECILKRDHHCGFTGCCIGYHNHRYYLVGISYIWLGALYGVWYQWHYIFSSLALPPLQAFFTLIAPHFAWLLGMVSLWGSFIATIHTVGLTTLCLVTFLLVLQLQAVLRGQTQYEHKNNIRAYSLCTKDNIQDVLGQRWFLVWLSPHISSPLKGDGVQFVKADEYENIKDI